MVCCSCNTKKRAIADLNKTSNTSPTLKVRALNLSEDLSRLASQNDEILLLGYKDQDIISDPVIMEYIIFDENQKLFNIPLKSDLFDSGELILVMLEIDTELKPEDIEMIVRKNIRDIELSFIENDRVNLKTILGDDDLLGIARVDKEKLKIIQTYNFIGTHKMDRYEYELEFIPLEIEK